MAANEARKRIYPMVVIGFSDTILPH